MEQSNKWKHSENIQRLSDLVGADVPKDYLKVAVVEQVLDSLDVTVQNGELSVSGGEIDVIDRDGRNLGNVDIASAIDIEDDDGRVLGDVDVVNQIQTALDAAVTANDDLSVEVANSNPIEVSIPGGSATAFANGTTLTASTENTFALSAVGAEYLDGRVVSSGSYDVEIRWQDDSGNTLFTESVASGVAGSTETSINTRTESPNAVVAIIDQSGADQTNTASLHLK